MCGFAGILDIGERAVEPVDSALLTLMADQIGHRGPDDANLYIDDQIGFAHRRLSIIDIENGAQPMSSADGAIVVVFNGEIFNFIELRHELIRQGSVFRTNSDTEVIVELYRKHGIAFVDKLNGQFSIAIWSTREKALHLIRDRVGICPLFYTFDRGRLVFGSEIKALIPALQGKPRIALQSLDQLFTFWSPVSPNTIFEGIYEISPGRVMTLSNGEVKTHVYWDWPVPEHCRPKSDEIALAEELHDLLVDATKIRLRADVPVGAYLSGGLDSSTIVSLILRHSDALLRTFSLVFDDKSFDESAFQKSFINHANVDHSQVSVNGRDIADELERVIWHTEVPILRSAPVPMGTLSKHVRESGYKVVLTGEGADECLGGYDIFKEAKVRQFWARDVESDWRPLLLKKLYPYLTLPKGRGAEYLKVFFGTGLSHPADLKFSHLPRWTTTAKSKVFFSAEIQSELSATIMDDYVGTLPRILRRTDSFNAAQYIEAKTLMGGYLLSSQGDRMLMKNSVEGRFPFLDHRVIEFASQIPPSLKMKVLNEKYLLKKAVEGYLPEKILARHKQPYRAPDVMTSDSLKKDSHLTEALSKDSVDKVGIFDAKKVGLLLRKARSNSHLSTSESQSIMGILTTQLVHKLFC